VRSETKKAGISSVHNKAVNPKKNAPRKTSRKSSGIASEKCPKCKRGAILKGKSAYGCSEFKNNCDFIMSFKFKGKTISEKQYIRMLQKGSTVNLKGFKVNNTAVEGLVRLDENFNLKLEPKKLINPKSYPVSEKSSGENSCPKCNKGTVIKGKTAYGCSQFKKGCDFRFSYDSIREKANGQPLTKDLVFKIFRGD
jgi:DNA topoisomerase-3